VILLLFVLMRMYLSVGIDVLFGNVMSDMLVMFVVEW